MLVVLGSSTSPTRRRNTRVAVVKIKFWCVGVVTLFFVLSHQCLDSLWSSMTTDSSQRVRRRQDGSVFRGRIDNLSTAMGETQRPSDALDKDTLSAVDAHPVGIDRRCATVRFRGNTESYSVADAAMIVAQQRLQQQTDSPDDDFSSSLSIGLSFVEDIDGFHSYHKGNFHLFHFLEFLVVSYVELHNLLNKVGNVTSVGLGIDDNATIDLTTFHSRRRRLQQTMAQLPTLQSAGILVPWIYVPHMTRTEICGTAGGINCLIADLLFHGKTKELNNLSDTWMTHIHGLESNDLATRRMASLYNGTIISMKQNRTVVLDDQGDRRYQEMSQEADAVLLVHRHYCNDVATRKMWGHHIENFPRQSWYQDISRGLAAIDSHDKKRPSTLAAPVDQRETNKKKFVVGYVDRQSSKRPLPEHYHTWLLQYFSGKSQVEFLHLQMENYTALEQIEIVASVDLLIGAHGNGLSHTFWQKPGRYLIELFWDYKFYFDYATAAEMMHHNYLCLYNGRALDPLQIQRRDSNLKRVHEQVYDTMPTTKEEFFAQITQGARNLTMFVDAAIEETLGVVL